MKIVFKLLFIGLAVSACHKKTACPDSQNTSVNINGSGNGIPYGNISYWKSIGGDTIFKGELTLTWFYTEKNPLCDICYYQLNYSLWNDYDYTYSVSKCVPINDTLIMKDAATNRIASFKRVK